ncbi:MULTISPECIES: hypothetical protein [Streptomyces]|uniref:hypothetical protein n=1 Tax=Streptomyces TaxID=1883 RepID=UPI00136FBF84|nr:MULTISPECIES: hypothetical protein [unclassified Streptomyces]MYT18524.1 hypothetical protein [Streptomyces sp. SID4951]
MRDVAELTDAGIAENRIVKATVEAVPRPASAAPVEPHRHAVHLAVLPGHL